jgi:hypothetical protein
MAAGHQAEDATEVHEPPRNPDSGQEQADDASREATREAAASHRQPRGPGSVTGRGVHQASPRTDEPGQRLPQPDRGQPPGEPSRDSALAGPKTHVPAVPPAHQPEPDPLQPSRRTNAFSEHRRGERNHHLPRHGLSDQDSLRDLGSHQVRPHDWQNFLTRSRQETWELRQTQPFGTTVFRTPEHGGPEREA